MKITILTLFPEMLAGPFDHSIIKRAREDGKLTIEYVHIRDFGIGTHKMADDKPYGGGVGMVLRADVVIPAIQKSKCSSACNEKIFLMDAGGEKFTQKIAQDLSILDHLILICGHYEGVDERVVEYIDGKISIGDYILTGGELPAMVITDAVCRLIPGILGKDDSSKEESFSEGLLEYPHYTRPEIFDEKKVPEILLSGNHSKINEWRKEQQINRTKKIRPDLLS